MSRSEYSRGGRVADTQPLARPRRFGPRCRRLGQARRAASTRGRRAGPGPYVSPMGRSAPADGPPSHGPGSAPSPRFWAALAFPSLRTRGRANAVLPLKSPGKSSRAKGCPGRLALAQTTLIEGSIALYRDAALGVGSPRVLLPAGSTESPRPGRDSRLRRAAGHGARRCARCRRHRRQIDSGLPTAAVSGSTVSGGETRHPLLNPRLHEERHHLALDGRCPAELRGSKPNAPTRLRGGALHQGPSVPARGDALPDVRDRFFEGGDSSYTALQQPVFDDFMDEQAKRLEKIKHHDRHPKKGHVPAHPRHHRKSQKHLHP